MVSRKVIKRALIDLKEKLEAIDEAEKSASHPEPKITIPSEERTGDIND